MATPRSRPNHNAYNVMQTVERIRRDLEALQERATTQSMQTRRALSAAHHQLSLAVDTLQSKLTEARAIRDWAKDRIENL